MMCNWERDLHKERAAEMFKVAYEDVTPEQRRAAKSSSFVERWNNNSLEKYPILKRKN